MTPFVGAAGKTFNRIFLTMIGTLIWGITNIGIGLASTFHQVCLVLSNAVCDDISYVTLQVLHIKLCPVLNLYLGLMVTWHDDSMLCTMKQHNFAT